MSREYISDKRNASLKNKPDPKISNYTLRTPNFKPKENIPLKFDKCSTPASTPTILSQSQDTTSTFIPKNNNFNKYLQELCTEAKINLYYAREIQNIRDSRHKYKYFCQQIANYSKITNWSIEDLPTPFGTVKVLYIHNRNYVDKFICMGNKYSSYKEILPVLDNSKHSNEIAKSILEYLETPAIDNFINLSSLQVKQYNSTELGDKELNCAKALSAILMISEPSQNRNYCGGALERALLRYIVNNKCKFSDVINKKLYPQMQKGGAAIARMLMSIPNELNSQMSPQGLDLMNQLPITPPTHYKLQ